MKLNSPCADKCFLEDFNACFSLYHDKTCTPYQKQTSLQTQQRLHKNSNENVDRVILANYLHERKEYSTSNIRTDGWLIGLVFLIKMPKKYML
jgi:hypothetical protein